jgi:hypothetical protein
MLPSLITTMIRDVAELKGTMSPARTSASMSLMKLMPPWA